MPFDFTKNGRAADAVALYKKVGLAPYVRLMPYIIR